MSNWEDCYPYIFLNFISPKHTFLSTTVTLNAITWSINYMYIGWKCRLYKKTTHTYSKLNKSNLLTPVHWDSQVSTHIILHFCYWETRRNSFTFHSTQLISDKPYDNEWPGIAPSPESLCGKSTAALLLCLPKLGGIQSLLLHLCWCHSHVLVFILNFQCLPLCILFNWFPSLVHSQNDHSLWELIFILSALTACVIALWKAVNPL